jgi:hypothetical protein
MTTQGTFHVLGSTLSALETSLVQTTTPSDPCGPQPRQAYTPHIGWPEQPTPQIALACSVEEGDTRPGAELRHPVKYGAFTFPYR